MAAGVLGDRAAAEDVLQEAALAALGKLGSFDAETSFVAWMSQVVRFVALNHRRKTERRQRALQATDGGPLCRGSGTVAGSPGFDAHVTRALQTLGETPRTCLLLKTVVELEYSEISEVLGIPAGTAMSHVSRSRAKMQKLLSESAPTLAAGAIQ